MPLKLIVGLGNPGKEYQKTRHNAGFMFIDAFCTHHNLGEWSVWPNGSFIKTIINEEE